MEKRIKKTSKILLIVFLVFLLNILIINNSYATTVEEVFVENVKNKLDYVTHESTVTDEMATSDYWANKIGKNADKVLLSPYEIAIINQEIIDGSGTNVFDITALNESKTQEQRKNNLVNSIDSDFLYMNRNDSSLPRNIYVGGNLIDNVAYISGMKNAVLSTGFEDNNAKIQLYGIGVKRTEIRMFPTNKVWGYDSPNDPDDESVNSALEVNEPFVIRAKCTFEGETFYYGLSYNCSGWVNAKHVAICSSKAEWLDAWKVDVDAKNFIVVTQDCITLMPSVNDNNSNLELKIGTVLKLVPNDNIPQKVDDRNIYNNFVVYIPTRDANGNYVKAYALISENNNISVGYLPLTQREILKVAFSCAGNRYGWGGMIGAMDCTLYTKSVYKCFGLELPRNTTWQQKVPNRVDNIQGWTDEQKHNYIKTLPIGSIFFISGHAMIYIGTENGIDYVISDSGSLSDSAGDIDVRSMYSVIVNPLTARRKNGSTWLTSLISTLVLANQNNDIINNEDIFVTVDVQDSKNNIIYPENVTKQMSNPNYWKDLLKVKNKVLANSESIKQLNNNLNGTGTKTYKKDFLVITQNRIILEPSILDPEISQIELPLGTTLELVPQDLIPRNLAERGPWHNFVVYLPITKSNGETITRMALIPEHYSVNIGYLNFSPENVIDLTLRCLGDSYHLMNNTQFINRIYKCFGLDIDLSKEINSKIPFNIIDISNKSLDEKSAFIKTLPVGSILKMQNQSLIYLGTVNNKIYTIGSINKENGNDINSVIIGTLDLKDNNHKLWLEGVNQVIDFTKEVQTFTDVLNTKWYFEGIRYSKSIGLIQGYGNGKYGPEDYITRGQVVTILYKLAGSPDVDWDNNKFKFEDLDLFKDLPYWKEPYYYKPCYWAANAGVAIGYLSQYGQRVDLNQGEFRPLSYITREEFAVMLTNFAEKILGKDTSSDFDLSIFKELRGFSINGKMHYSNISNWAVNSMEYLCEHGIFTGDMLLGYPRLQCYRETSRAEAATILMRFCKNIAGMN